jgi:L-2-hydroxyglutarate oxidase LhgO
MTDRDGRAELDVTVVGGGIVGCAVAAAAAAAGFSTVLVERESLLGAGTTSRNSEVAHGGMYYPTGSHKARLCVAGRRRLKAFCEARGVRYHECGKLVVAVTEDEVPELERLLVLGEANGVEDLRLLDGAEVARLEPAVRAVGALWSPRTAVVDAEGAARAYGEQAGRDGAQIMTRAEVTALEPTGGGWRVTVAPPQGQGREGWTHTSRWVVNAAGLSSDRVAALAGVDLDARGWRLRWTKGSYFAIAQRHEGKVGRLVYPVPPRDGSSLGVHLCLDLAGRLRLGPDVEPLDPGAGEDYAVDPDRAALFLAGGRRFLPFLEEGDLTPDMCGLRPRLASWRPGVFSDFVIRREEGALEGLVNLVAIESPGLTCAPALAEEVAAWLRAR